jgi:hypothetical protein
VDRRHQDVRGPIVTELHDQLGKVGLPRGDARCLERLVELDLGRGHRLDLDDLIDAMRAHDTGDDLVGLRGVPGPVHDPAGLGDHHLQVGQGLLEAVHRVLLERLARLAQLLPVGDLLDHLSALVPDRGGGLT